MTTDQPLILTRDEIRRVDAAAVSELGIPSLVLMENAARGVADVIRREFADANRRVIVCGHGNNGGDGFALARQLAADGISVEVVLVMAGHTLSEDAAVNRDILTAAGLSIDHGGDGCLRSLTKNDLIVDCLLGTGVRGAARPPADAVIDVMNLSPARVLAVDVPSGLDCQTGGATGPCVRADRTVTFVGLKQGFRESGADRFVGDVSVAHIGIPDVWLRSWLRGIRGAP